MNFPPMVMRMKISRRARGFSLWLPLFIVVPVVAIVMLVLFLILLPFILIAAAIVWRSRLWRPLFFFWPTVFRCFSAMRGLEVDIVQNDEQVFISFK